MSVEVIKTQLRSLPEFDDWPELVHIFDRAAQISHPDWQLPVLTCQAVGGSEAAAGVGVAAIACMQISIILVDDMLDDDPRGEHLKRGYGPTANAAIAYQAAAFRFVEQAAIGNDLRAAMTACLSRLALATAVGQHLDVQNLQGEENYWKVIRAKSTPFYGAAYQLGAILGGAPQTQAAGLYDLGILVGEIIQIEDDLDDAFQTPMNPDWRHGRNNLLLLYARTALHDQRDYFATLLARIDEADALAEAQRILYQSGAFSYAVYHLVTRYQAALRLLKNLHLADPRPLTTVLEAYGDTLVARLKANGLDISRDMLSHFSP